MQSKPSLVGDKWSDTRASLQQSDAFSPEVMNPIQRRARRGEYHAKFLDTEFVSSRRIAPINSIGVLRTHPVWRIPTLWDPKNYHEPAIDRHGLHLKSRYPRFKSVSGQAFQALQLLVRISGKRRD